MEDSKMTGCVAGVGAAKNCNRRSAVVTTCVNLKAINYEAHSNSIATTMTATRRMTATGNVDNMLPKLPTNPTTSKSVNTFNYNYNFCTTCRGCVRR